MLFSVTGRTAKNGVVYKNNNRKPASTLTKQLELHIKGFYCVFVRFAMNLIAFSGPRNCVNTQYAALPRAMAFGVGEMLTLRSTAVLPSGSSESPSHTSMNMVC